MPLLYWFLLPAVTVRLIYILAAVLPAWILLRYIYRHDTVEKEPMGLLVSLLGMGVLSALCSILLERIGQTLLYWLMDPGSPYFTVVLAFVVVALVEEGTKFFFLKWRTWRNPHFNYRFDGIVYAVFVSLGFAAYENIGYVLNYGLSVALPRALLAVPAHMSFAVFMGVFYSRAKLMAVDGDNWGCRINLGVGYLIAVLLHGAYDACALSGSNLAVIAFAGLVLVMFLSVFFLIKRESAADMPVS